MRLRKSEQWFENRLNNCGLCAFDSGGDTPAAPDYGALANASKESAQLVTDLGNRQLQESQRQYDQNMAVAKPIIDKQTALMDQQVTQGNESYQSYKDNYQPIEQQLAQDVKNGTSSYDTSGAVRAAAEREASRAASDVSSAQANTNDQTTRAMLSMGVNPNSGKFAASRLATDVMGAAQRAGAMTNARDSAVATDYAKKTDMVNAGRSLVGLANTSYSGANTSGNSAVSNQTGVSANYTNGLNAGVNTIAGGQQIGLNGLSASTNGQASAYNAGLQRDSANASGLGSLLGLAVAASSKKLKTNKTPLDEDAVLSAVKKMPVESWKYNDGVADGGEHIGPYAEDVHQAFGDKAAPGGKAIDLVSMNGIGLASIRALAKQVDRIESRLGKED